MLCFLLLVVVVNFVMVAIQDRLDEFYVLLVGFTVWIRRMGGEYQDEPCVSWLHFTAL